MRIQNVKLGHSTNSSSSHSMIYAPNHTLGDVDAFEDYGWGHFVLASEKAKLDYFASMVACNLNLPEWLGIPVYGALTGQLCTPRSIDHQSIKYFPRVFGHPDKLNADFINDYMKYVSKPEIVILGGNDNGGNHPDRRAGETVSMEFQSQMRKDGDWWVSFNNETGHRMIMSFEDNPRPLHRGVTPMLVDLKITSYCPYDCPFCYQGSTALDGHASIDAIERFVAQAVECEVFEIAIGGGEPTLHPNFLNILELFNGTGVNVSFTTRNIDWVLKCESLRHKFKALAVSVYSVAEIEKLATKIQNNYGAEEGKVVLHIVMGTVDMPTFIAMMHAARKHHFAVTLLGYKMVGRGHQFTPHNYDTWVEELFQLAGKAKDLPRFSIDTALAVTSERQLRALGLPKWMYFVQEGKYSCYVDLVAGQIAPSSFCGEDKYIGFTDLRTNWNMIEAV